MITQEQRNLRNAIVSHAHYTEAELDPTIEALISVLGSVIEGVPIERALGAPGDWGYGTRIGDALLAYLQANRAPESNTTNELTDEQCRQLILNTAVHDLKQEIERARRLYPGTEKLLPALMEEVGELARALLDEGDGDYREEAIQVACVSLRIATEGTSDFPFTLPVED